MLILRALVELGWLRRDLSLPSGQDDQMQHNFKKSTPSGFWRRITLHTRLHVRQIKGKLKTRKKSYSLLFYEMRIG
jgi:hypothetical protein